ncbi:MAG TPA: toll/interleukin-1 receptor domain-containing protein [Kofleriaceae bacterium]|nr:toll/interleukin-1 receptor domain-containing protein [Kofleriaceae bacterium]
MARVLLSSVSEDRPAMRRLAEALRRAGHEPRLDADWSRLEEVPAEEIERDKDMTGAPWWSAAEGAVEASDALIIGYSTATERRRLAWQYMNAFWTAAAAGRPAFIARLDEARLWIKVIGAHAFDLRRSSWERDVGPLIAALDRPGSAFVGRELELAWLAHELHMGSQAAVVGEDGVGKNALVAEYARRHAAEYIGGCLVTDAGRGELVAAAALGALARKGPRLAIVVDAADDALSSLYRSRGTYRVIVTARARPAGFPGPVLELARLSPEEASRLFDGRAGPTDDPVEIQERREIVAAAGGLPRALVLAAELRRRG